MRADAAVIARGTTRGLPPGDDYDYFCAAVAEVYVGVRPQPPHAAFPADYALYDLGATKLGVLSTPSVVGVRDRRAMAAHPDDAVFLNFSRSPWTAQHLGRTWQVPRGVPFALDNDRPFTVVPAPRSRLQLYSLRVPRDALTSRVRALDDALVRARAGSHVARQVALLADLVDAGRLDVAATMADVVVALLDGVAHTGAPPAAARLAAYKTAALEHLGDPSYGVTSLARSFACSARTVQAAFAAGGETFGEWLAGERLELARRVLADPRTRDVPLHRVAARCGYAGTSAFHRAFRRRFGVTPGSVRG